MKKLRNIALPLLASLALFACEKDYDAPLLTEPEYTGPEANITIKDLRAQTSAATQDAPVVLTQEQVLKAVVTANDESGNIFKKIYLEDETGAIEMEVDQGSVYNYYPVGQTVYIDLKGLSISVYGDEQQLGHPEGYLYRTPWEEFEKHVIRDGWANPENAKPLELDDISVINADPETYKFKLVTLKGVTFQNGGTAIFAPEDSKGQEEAITDAHGNTLAVRTSGYANFAANKLPKGKGNLTGILGRFRGNWQFTIRTAEDIKDFVEVPEEGGQGGETQPGVTETILEAKFDKDGGKGEFTFEDVTLPAGSDHVWAHANFNETYYMMARAFVNGANQESESRLVSPELNLTGKGNVILSFMHTFKTFGADTHLDDLKLEVREKGTTAWEEVTIPNYSTGADNKFVASGDIDLSKFAGKTIQFAFHYKSSKANALRWQINNLKVVASSGSGDGGNVIEPTPNE